MDDLGRRGGRRARYCPVGRETQLTRCRAERRVQGAERPRQEAVKRYDVCWAGLDPVAGSEMAKTRPVVIVSLDVLNERLATVVVCPLTTQLHPSWRTRVSVSVAGKDLEIAADQIRTISKSRLGRK